MSALPRGSAFYNERLANQTTTTMTADEIHRVGLAEVARLRQEMEAIRKEVGFAGDLKAFFAELRDNKDDPRYFYPDTDDGRNAYLRDATAAIDKIKAVLPKYFGLLPKADMVVKRVEPFREQPGAAQHYFPSTPDGARPGIYYAHLSDMKAMPKSELEVVAYHEGLPGHHMQIAIAQELTGVPTFRRQARFTAYSEGWGLYAEWLAREMPGTYEDPYPVLAVWAPRSGGRSAWSSTPVCTPRGGRSSRRWTTFSRTPRRPRRRRSRKCDAISCCRGRRRATRSGC